MQINNIFSTKLQKEDGLLTQTKVIVTFIFDFCIIQWLKKKKVNDNTKKKSSYNRINWNKQRLAS